MGFDEVFQFRWVIRLPVGECEHASKILLELGDPGGSATMDLAEQVSQKALLQSVSLFNVSIDAQLALR